MAKKTSGKKKPARKTSSKTPQAKPAKISERSRIKLTTEMKKGIKASYDLATVILKDENKAFHIRVEGPIDGGYGAHVRTTGTTMRLAHFEIEDGYLDVRSKVHRAIRHITISVRSGGKLYITRGRDHIDDIER